MRKLVNILLSLLLVAPAAALALGVGEVQLYSALNQRLNAEIELLSVDPAEADSIEVSLASYEDFARVGLERPSSLMFLRFNVEQSPSGQYSIKISSSEAIRDPFLDFLVEVKWRSGRVLREYTLLLDPPVSHQEAAPAVAAPLTAPATVSTPAIQEQAREEEFVPPPSSIPVAPGYESPAVAKPAPVVPAAPVERAPAAPAPAPTKSIVYGPVKANETLWRIAQKLRPEGVTDQQMMMALLIANPYAFIDNNINRLKKGYVLRIDDLSVLTAMSKAEASREVASQTRAWEDHRAAIAAKAAAREPVSATKEQPSAAVASAKKEPKLELVTPEGKAEQPGMATEGADSVQQELMLALESSAAQRKENEELQKRVEGLEEQLQDMQRLLTLKDADLATLQKQLREQGQALTLPSQQAETAPAAKPAAVESDATAAPAEKAPEAVVKPATKTPEAAAPKPAAKTPEATAPKPAAEKPASENKPAVKKPPVVVPPPEEPSFVDMVFGMIDNMGASLGDPMMMAAGGGAILLILLLLLVMIRRRRGSGFQESILTGGTSSMMGSQDDEGNSETSFLSDLAISGMGKSTIHTDEGEVDPLTEADVFMAYGRYQQAEEVLKKAIEKHPERVELTAKLLEVYYQLKEKDKFVALAESSSDRLQANEGEWARIAKMGAEMSPGTALFAAAAAAAATMATADVASEEAFAGDVLDIGLDLDELTSETPAGNTAGEAELDFDLGLDLGDLDEPENSASSAAALDAAVPEETGADFDFDLDLGGEVAEESAPETAESDFDFDLDLGGETTQETASAEEAGLDFDLGGMAEIEEAPAESSNEFDLDFGSEEIGGEDDGLSLDFGAVSDSAEPETASDAGLDLGDLDDLDFGDLGLDEGTAETASSEEDSFDLDMSALESGGDDLGGLGGLDDLGDLDDDGMFGDSDEIATKLDLAQAYIEMGDSDGARSMLEEVAEGGNSEQKQQAQELLARI